MAMARPARPPPTIKNRHGHLVTTPSGFCIFGAVIDFTVFTCLFDCVSRDGDKILGAMKCFGQKTKNLILT